METRMAYRIAAGLLLGLAAGVGGCSRHTERGMTELNSGASRSWTVDGLDIKLRVLNEGPGELRVLIGGLSRTDLDAGSEHRVTLNKAASAEPITVELSAPDARTVAIWELVGPLNWELRENER